MKPVFKKPARKATPEVLAGILEDLALGLTRAQACAAHGVHENSLKKWEKRPEFSDLRAKTEAARIKYLLGKIEQCADQSKDWKGHSFQLEKRFPEQFGQGGALLAQQNNFFFDDVKSRELSERAKRLMESDEISTP